MAISIYVYNSPVQGRKALIQLKKELEDVIDQPQTVELCVERQKKFVCVTLDGKAGTVYADQPYDAGDNTVVSFQFATFDQIQAMMEVVRDFLAKYGQEKVAYEIVPKAVPQKHDLDVGDL